jgi:hypothetical protein
MASLEFAHGSIQWLTTQALNTTISVTGLTFSPKAIRFYWVGLQSNPPTNANSQAVSERRGVGFASSTTSRACVGTTSTDNSGSADCGSIWSNTACVITVSAAGAVDGLLDINSIDTDGFTLIVDDVVPDNITVFWEAWGGNDITDVTIGAIAEPAATGVQNYTATGFVAEPEPNTQCVMLAGVQTVNVSGTGQQQDSGLHVGFATSTSTADQITVCGNSDDGSATMDTDGYNRTGECLSMIVIAGGNPNARATLSAFGTNQFTLNWLARATTNRRSIYMAIKGGKWSAGSITINGNTLNSTSTIPLIPFNIKGVSLIGNMRVESAVGTSSVQDRIGFGSGISPTSRNSAGVLDENGTANAEIDLSIYYDQVLVYPSAAGALQTAYDISSVSANNLVITTDTAGGVANEWIGYLVFGNRKLNVASIGHPFIN